MSETFFPITSVIQLPDSSDTTTWTMANSTVHAVAINLKPRLVTCEAKVGTSPFPDMSVKTSLQGQGQVKVARIENKATLVELDVLFDQVGGKHFKGMKVLVRGDQYTNNWAKEQFEFEGQKYILIPVDKIEALVYRT